MVQVVDNRSRLSGRVVSCAPADGLDGHLSIAIANARLSAVDGFPNLLQGTGGVLHVLARESMAAGLEPGAAVDLLVRSAGQGRVFLVRDP